MLGLLRPLYDVKYMILLLKIEPVATQNAADFNHL